MRNRDTFILGVGVGAILYFLILVLIAWWFGGVSCLTDDGARCVITELDKIRGGG